MVKAEEAGLSFEELPDLDNIVRLMAQLEEMSKDVRSKLRKIKAKPAI
jgi:hypothetical protein